MQPSRRALLLSALPLLRAQEDTTIRVDVKVVNILASVRTKKGEIIRNLGQEDFAVSENGRPQKLRYFSRETDLPLTIGLMVDTSMSQQKVLIAERGACRRFLDQVLRNDKDQVFIMQFDMSVKTAQILTSSRQKLDEALAYVDTPTRQQLMQQIGGGTLLYDAMSMGANDVMSKVTGRKALIVLSDGVDTGSHLAIADSIEAAQRNDTIVYSVYFTDPNAYGIFGGMGPNGRAVLQRMAHETGGGFFEVSKKLSIEQVFDQIQDELRSQYNLGYVSDVPVEISEFRKLQLTVKQKGLVVQARDRYWAKR
jgi:VWFA-related protein